MGLEVNRTYFNSLHKETYGYDVMCMLADFTV